MSKEENKAQNPNANYSVDGIVKELSEVAKRGGELGTFLDAVVSSRKQLEYFIFSKREMLYLKKEAAIKEAKETPPIQAAKKQEPKAVASPKTVVEEPQKPPRPRPQIQMPAVPSYVRGVKKHEPVLPTRPPYIKPSSDPRADRGRPQYQGRQQNPSAAGYPQRPHGTKPPFPPSKAPSPPYTGQPRPQQGGTAPPPRTFGQPFVPQGAFAANKDKKPIFSTAPKSVLPPKRKDQKGGDDRGGMNKRTLIRKGYIEKSGLENERFGVRRLKNKKKIDTPPPQAMKIEKAVITTENLTVKILSEKIGKTAQEIIKKLMTLDILTTINSVVDFPTMELVANEFGVALELKLDKTQEEILEAGHEKGDNEKELKKRPPVIAVMGHVDHGKTSLLDYIRKAKVASGEAGGITQHIGAYSVKIKKESITFLDTPGHEAFTQMRARGAQITDIAIIVVAADDGIMPQTIEAINHVKAAKVPIIVAINKIDKAGANVEKVKQMLGEHGLVPEEWGGDTMMIAISAKLGDGIDKLLESILLLAEVYNYRANPNRLARASVVEAKVDKGRGPLATVIVLNGTLRIGDFVVCGTSVGRVRAMTDFNGKSVKETLPGNPVSILGFTEVPNAGDMVLVVENEKIAKQVASERIAKWRIEKSNTNQKVTIDDILRKTDPDRLKELNLIVKADVQGSVEALKESLSSLKNEEAKVKIIHSGVGAVNKTDIMLAEASHAVIVAFNVPVNSETKASAKEGGIIIKSYKVIYAAIEAITKMLKGMLTPKYKEIITGKAEARNIFKITGSGIIAGSYVLSGKIYRNSKVRVYRGEEKIFEGAVKGLKRFKEDVKEVAEGYECGISVEGFSDIKELDIIEAYQLELIEN